MKQLLKGITLFSIVSIITSCEEDQGLLPKISFKTGGNYISSDTTLAGASPILIGIDAAKSEEVDVLKKFNISLSVNGTTAIPLYNKDLSGSEGDKYTYDLPAVLDTIHGQADKFIFTVTNRDGLVNQVSLTVTIQ